MKKFLLAIIAFAAVLSFAACSDSETYAEQRDRERDSINAFLRNENIKVISEDVFKQRWENNVTPLTDTSADNNEYVLFESNGVYMQVVDQGTGEYIKKGETAEVLARFDEYCISALARIDNDNYSNLTLSNNLVAYSYVYDKMSVTNTSGTFEASFDTSQSLMANTYGSSSYGSTSGVVPSGWLVPFSWVKIGRANGKDEHPAHVRLIIPHSYGTTSASASVYAYFYDITFRRGTKK